MNHVDPTQDRGYFIVSLSTLLEYLGEEKTSNILSSFKSHMESDTETFLREKAIEMERRDISRTYIGLSSDGISILGYVTVSIKCLRVPDDNCLSNKALEKMNIDGATGIAQSYLIGQLSRSKDSPRGFGSVLMEVALRQLTVSKSAVGCRLVRLDCYEELIPYYGGHGFRPITRNDDGTLNQMMRLI